MSAASAVAAGPPAAGSARPAADEKPAAAPAPDFRLPVRVYYEDTDAAGVVYYANYLRFLERARSEWLLSLGHVFSGAGIDRGHAFVVRRAHLEYLAPARLGDVLEVTVAVARLLRASLSLEQTVALGARRLVEARIDLACVDTSSWRPSRIPDTLMKTLERSR